MEVLLVGPTKELAPEPVMWANKGRRELVLTPHQHMGGLAVLGTPHAWLTAVYGPVQASVSRAFSYENTFENNSLYSKF